jgi:glycosyltransferase involved in cell wall biosynthesis
MPPSTSTPLVAVIIPAYNRAYCLERAIRSVLTQTFGAYKIIVVDDGSTDGTAALPIFDKADERLMYVRQEKNRGVSAARNAGVQHSDTPWIAFLDSDDQWHPDKLQRQVAWLENHPDCRIMQTREIWIRNGRRVNAPRTHEKTAGDIFTPSLDRCMITPSSVILQRSLFDEAGGFDESFPACEDYDLWLRITCRHRVGLIDECLLTRYGGHGDQLSSSVPVLDKFRIRSIINLLQGSLPDERQRAVARSVVCRKAAIVANGCLKRGNREEYERYAEIVGHYA